jgi:hypothetical protein
VSFEYKPALHDDDGPPPEITDEQRTRFLELIREDPTVGNVPALRQVGVEGRKSALRALLDADEELVDDARRARGGDDAQIRNAIVQRGIHGVEEPVINHKGDIVGTRMVFSDRLLEFAARMWLPEAKELRQGHVQHQHGGVVGVIHADIDDAIERLVETLGSDGETPAAGPPARRALGPGSTD